MTAPSIWNAVAERSGDTAFPRSADSRCGLETAEGFVEGGREAALAWGDSLFTWQRHHFLDSDARRRCSEIWWTNMLARLLRLGSPEI